jgi:hypothetical protein
MSKLRLVLAFSSLFALAACGDNLTRPDARPKDGSDTDNNPPVPRLGTQIDRMGRPAINTALVGLSDVSDVAMMKKDAYNLGTDPNLWSMAPVANGRSTAVELAANLALLDVLDQGNVTILGTTGCKNQILYNGDPSGGGDPRVDSYSTLAGFLADDMLYVDTTKTTCSSYLSLEIEAATGGQIPHTQCGGRTPTHDVIDVSYSLLLAGLNGFTLPPALVPKISDGVAAHTDVSDTAFPYFGAPH